MDNETIDTYIEEVMARLHTGIEPGASASEIEAYLSRYDDSQLDGVMNNVKGHLAEKLYVMNENNDGDSIYASLHENPNHEASDVILEDSSIGDEEFVQVKATDNASYVRSAMKEHPDIRVVATEEVAEEVGVESIGYSNEEIEAEVYRYFEERGVIDSDEYIEAVDLEEGTEFTETTYENVNDMMFELDDVLSWGLTGGFLATMEFLKNQPDKQKKLIKVGIATGLIDSIVDFDTLSLEDGFVLNPLLVTSLAIGLNYAGLHSNNPTIRQISTRTAVGISKVVKVMEVTSYVALGVSILDFFTGVELIEEFAELLDVLDVFDVIDTLEMVDVIEGAATMGLSIIASKGVRHFMEKYNEKDRKEMRSLYEQVEMKRLLREMLKADVPIPLVVGLYEEVK